MRFIKYLGAKMKMYVFPVKEGQPVPTLDDRPSVVSPGVDATLLRFAMFLAAWGAGAGAAVLIALAS